MRSLLIPLVSLVLILSTSSAAQRGPYRTLDDKFEPPAFTDTAAWQKRAAYLRERILVSAGLMPMPERTPLRAEIFGELKRNDYTVSKVYFESLPGFYVTGNLYRPAGSGPFPAVLSPHGHWAYGRLENTPLNSGPGRAISLARQGYVVFSYDMVGYGDSRQVPHTFGNRRATLWGLTLAGLQLWNSIRSLDFLESLPDVNKAQIGVTGESGGGTQTFLLTAIDPRPAVAVPVNMISLHMQGGCLCENAPGLRLDTTNVEIAATIAPRPMLMVAASGDWTVNTLEREYPAIASFYRLMDAPDRVHAVRFTAEHNYNKESREAMYAWMARWLKGAPADVQVRERSFTADPPADLMVFHQRPLPPGAVDADRLTDNWIAAARRQLTTGDGAVQARALRHALGYGDPEPKMTTAGRSAAGRRTVLVAGLDAETEQALRAAKLDVRPISFTTFDAAAAAKVRHFETYNRTEAAERVADIVTGLRAYPDAAIVASGDAALAALLASAVIRPRVAVLDVGNFDRENDAAFVERLFIPGLRRAGDLQTAATLGGDALLLHNAGDRFTVTAPRLQRTKLTAREIVSAVRR